MVARKLLGVVSVGALFAGIALANPSGARTPGPRDERRAIDTADQATARAIVIRPSDLPGWKPVSRFPASDGPNPCPKYDPDLSSVIVTGHERGRQFVRRLGEDNEVFTSEVELFASETHARTKWRAGTSAAAVACFREQLSSLAPPGAIVITDNAIPLDLPAVAPLRFGRRYQMIWVTGGELGGVWIDYIYLVRGRAAVSLMAQRAGLPPKAPPTSAVERRLAKVLGKRLAVASG